MGINKHTLHTWIGKYHRLKQRKAEPVGDEHFYDEVKRLRQENRRLTEARDLLKKAAAYFAKESL